MRLAIDHHSEYRFSQPQDRVVQLLRATPSDYGAQTVIEWAIDVDCDARLRTGRDGYGNVTTMLYVDGPVERLALTVRGQVLTEDMAGIVRGVAEPLPPLFFTRPTSITCPEDAVRALAATIAEADPLARAHQLSQRVGETIRIDGGRTPTMPAEKVLERGHGSVRDAAHLLVAIGHAAGYPARMVAGHSIHGPDSGARQSAHYWAELHIVGLGWIGLDPCSGFSPDESYVRVAVGRDGAEVAPVSGTRRGGGIEELDVAVRVGAA